MKKLILFGLVLCLVLSTNSGLLAQYSNASVKGPWLLNQYPLPLVNDTETIYLVFDGNGNITDMGGFGTCTGNYSVIGNGTFTGTFCSHAFSGQFISQNYGMVSINGNNLKLSRIMNPGALTDTLTGEIGFVCGTKNIKLTLNSNGEITNAIGLTPPVTGRIYADSGIFIGHLKTGDASITSCTISGNKIEGLWDEFTIIGTYKNDSLIGVLDIDGPHSTPFGTVKLVRKSGITGINELRVENGEWRINVYPNPANQLTIINYQLTIKSNVTIKIYDVTGREVDELGIRNEELGINKINYDAGKLKRGVYFVKLTSDFGIGVTKFIKE